MSNYLLEEEEILVKREVRKNKNSRDTYFMKRCLFALAIGSALTWINLSYGGECSVVCPSCSEIIPIQFEAKEIPGAGCECNNCGMFYCHGDRCPYCSWPRYKKKTY